MMRYTAPLAALLVVAAQLPAAAENGVYLEEEVLKSLGSGPPRSETARTWLVPGKLRKEDGAGGTITIAREDKKALWVLNPAEKTWFEIDRDAFERLGQLGLSALLDGRAGDAGSWFARSGREKRVGRWNAYEVLAEDKPIPGTRFSIWLSKEVPIDPKLREAAGGAFGTANPGARLLDAIRKMDGYPVEVSLTFRAGATVMEVRQTLRKVESLDVPAERFEVPAGFTRVESPFQGLLATPPPPPTTPAPAAAATPGPSPPPPPGPTRTR